MNRREYDIDGTKLVVVDKKITTQLHEGYPIGGDYVDNLIRIDPRQSTRAQRMTIVHEVQHHFAERSAIRDEFRRRLGTREARRLEEFVIEELTMWWGATSDSAPDLLREMFNL